MTPFAMVVADILPGGPESGGTSARLMSQDDDSRFKDYLDQAEAANQSQTTGPPEPVKPPQKTQPPDGAANGAETARVADQTTSSETAKNAADAAVRKSGDGKGDTAGRPGDNHTRKAGRGDGQGRGEHARSAGASGESPEAKAEAMARAHLRFQESLGIGTAPAGQASAEGEASAGGMDPFSAILAQISGRGGGEGMMGGSGQAFPDASSLASQVAALMKMAGGGSAAGGKSEMLDATQAGQGMTMTRANGRSMAAKVMSASKPLPANAPNFADELSGRIGKLRMISRPGMPDQVRISLEPRELGELNVRLAMDSNSQQVHIMITAETEAARELLSRHMAQLREALARHDLQFGEVMVEVNDQQKEAPQWSFERESAFAGDEGGAEAATPCRRCGKR
jgi:hypothetical protein